MIGYADGTSERWTYDASGNVASFKNRKGNTQTYAAYDGRNRPTGWGWDDGVTGGAGMAYDAAGRCTFFSNGWSLLTMSYDDSGALKSEGQNILSQSNPSNYTVNYTPRPDGTDCVSPHHPLRSFDLISVVTT